MEIYTTQMKLSGHPSTIIRCRTWSYVRVSTLTMDELAHRLQVPISTLGTVRKMHHGARLLFH